MKYERVLKGWEKQHNGTGATDRGYVPGPDGSRFYVILEGEFEYETVDKETMKIRKSGAGMSKRDFDVRKLLFSRKKATIDDRRRVIVSEEKRLKLG